MLSSSTPSPSSSIYQTDDQQDRRLEDDDKRYASTQRKDITVAAISDSATAVHTNSNLEHTVENNNIDDVLTVNKGIVQNDESVKNIDQEQLMDTEDMKKNYAEKTDEDNDDSDLNHWLTDDQQQYDDNTTDYDHGYQLLTCRSTNNLYTIFRW